jgi:hypothetical protein
MRALLRKELREVLGIAVAALAGYLALVASLMGARVFDWIPGMPHGTNEVPFIGNEFTPFFTFVSVLLAVTLGFRQSAWESGRGTYLFLLHRPLRRESIFLLKLAVGLGVFLGCTSLPILVYASWATGPSRHPSPFAWSMTEPAWQLVLSLPLLYLGAFLSGLRPARWFGTRLLPLFASVIFVVLVNVVPWWWPLGVLLTLLLYGVLAAIICYMGRVRDYA